MVRLIVDLMCLLGDCVCVALLVWLCVLVVCVVTDLRFLFCGLFVFGLRCVVLVYACGVRVGLGCGGWFGCVIVFIPVGLVVKLA